MKFKRILLKLSGEALLGEKDFGIDPKQIEQYANDVKAIVDKGVEVAIVIGAGNIFRGIQAEETGIDRASGDYMGMLGTVMNGVALQSGFENIGLNTRLVSAIEMKEIAESYIRRRAIRHLEKGRVVIFVAGTGSPYFTTDSAAALRSSEINADVLIKGTRVNGVYTADPEKDSTATKFETISFDDIISKKLPVMDMTAFTMCQENNMPIIVFDMNKKGSLLKVLEGENIGTLVQ